MKKLLAIAAASSLLLVPYMIYGQSDQQVSEPPSVAAPLVREGDFAVKLVGALNIRTAGNEAEAESVLVSMGVSPRNGWISDYPVTPDVLAEIQTAVSNAADGGRLPTGRDQALKVFRTAAVELGLPITVEIPSSYAENAPPTSPQYTEPGAVEDYYAEQGPPVVTYYPPPPDYGYLYAWVPSPFWFSGFFFPGFFVLNDFDVVVVGHHHHHHRFTNHYFDSRTRTVARIDPVTRTGRAFGGTSGSHNGFTSAEGRRGAQSIWQHSHDRMISPRGSTGGNLVAPRSQGTPPSFNGARGRRTEVAPRENFRGAPRISSGRSFSAPSVSRGGLSEGFHGGGSVFSGGVARESHGISVAHGGSFGHGGSLGGFHGGGFRGR